MDPKRQQQQKARAASLSGVFNLIPAVSQKNRKVVAARFPTEKDAPNHKDNVEAKYILSLEQQPAKQQKGEQQQQQQEPSLLINCKPARGSAKQLQGVPRPDAVGNYFMLSKAGRNDFFLQPLDATFTFKQLARNPGLSIDEVEAQMRSAAGGGADPARLLPKSMRQQMRESEAAAAAEKQLQEEVVPLFDKNKVAELSVKYGGPTTQGNKLVLGASDDEEGSDEGWGLTGADEEEGGTGKKKGPAKDKDKKGGKGASKGRKGAKDAGGEGIPEDEMPEDIFAGEEDELRPAAPVEDADWEYNEDAADDDLDQGASDEEGLADDPGYRKQLGLEADEEEEEKKEEGAEGEDADKKEGDGAAAGADSAVAGAPSQDFAGGSAGGESESVMDEDDLGLVDAEDLDLDRLAEEREHSIGQPAKRRKGSVGPPGRDRSPAPSRLATPPLGSTAAAAAAAGGSRKTPPLDGGRRGSTPPLGKAAAGSSRKTPPPGAAAAGARRTPPPAGAAAAAAAAGGAAKRKREEAAAGAAAAASAGAALAAGAAAGAAGAAPAAVGPVRGYVWRSEQLDAQGVPTVESVAQALQDMGPITTSQLSLLQEHLDVGRIGDEGKKLLKMRMLQVAKVEARNGVKYVVLKHS